ncbi:MAG: S-methyl-5-thioribose-1-phosphate isomerase [Gemmatimonadota bacterium]
MKNAPRRPVSVGDDGWSVQIIDQTLLPHEFRLARLSSVEQAAQAISSMQVRGAPLVGATAAYGLCLAIREDPSDEAIAAAAKLLLETRPTAVNLSWALEQVRKAVLELAPGEREAAAYARTAELVEDDVETCRRIGEHGLPLLESLAEKRGGGPVNILTHCNAGWLATVEWGTATSSIYQAHEAGIPLHVWVGETRPRNQGARLTAWELGQKGVPHTIIADSAGGHLMQHGEVDILLTGTDRTTRTGDVCNKIGTYLKALAAHDNGVPFYAAVPYSSIDWEMESGDAVPIEQRDPREVTHIRGQVGAGHVLSVRITPEDSPAANYAFDVTPARLVTGIITERGVCEASREGLLGLYPERRRGS